jgi:hypothetical protein
MDFWKSNERGLATGLSSGWSGRLRGGRVPLIALALVAMSAANAYALDVCLNFAGGGTVVLKRFKTPPPNKCAPVQGFEPVGGGGALSGMACSAAAGKGTEMRLHYTYHDMQSNTGYFEAATCRFILPIAPSNGGRCWGTVLVSPGTGQDHFEQSVTPTYCNVDVPRS